MKLLIAFIQREDSAKLLRRLRDSHLAVTAIESEGGFLRKRNVTIVTALDDAAVPGALQIIRDVCRKRTERVDTTFATGTIESVGLPASEEIPIGGATVLLLDVADVIKI